MLAVPALFGALAGWMHLFARLDEAIETLNKYALYLGFPALIIVSLSSRSGTLPESPAFWLLWPLALATSLLVLRLMARQAQRGSLALVACFGNVAYLGLPYATTLYGETLAGPAALAVSIHVTGAVTLGPALLAHWGAAESPNLFQLSQRVLRLPLFWAPGIGLALRLLPDQILIPTRDALSPLAQSAAPVALFLLGLYLYQQRDQLFRPSLSLVAHLFARQILPPLLMLIFAVLAIEQGWISAPLARLHILLAAMPVAITTFSMAHDTGTGSRDVAAAIVWSSTLSLLTLPAWASLADWLTS